VPPSIGRFLLFVGAWISILIPTITRADAPSVVDALDLVVDPVTRSRTVPDLPIGSTFQVHATVDALSALTIGAYQFAIETDPTLLVIGVELPPSTEFSITEPPSRVTVGLGQPLLTRDGPHVLATWTILRTAGADPSTPGFVRVTSMPNGEVAQYAAPGPAFHTADFIVTGSVLVGDTDPQLQWFLPSESVVVRDRTYGLSWHGVGITDVALDGLPVDASGTASPIAVNARDHVLTWNEDGIARERTIAIDVIDTPRVSLFEATEVGGENPDLVRVSWRIDGAEGVWWDPGNEFVTTNGERGVVATGPTPITLHAENEWGRTYATIVLRSDGAPAIGTFVSDHPAVPAGESTTLRWSVADADLVVIEPLGLEVDPVGSLTVMPDETTTYTLVASGAGPAATADLTIEVETLRIVGFSVSPTELEWGDPLMIAWNVVDADSIWIEPDVGGLATAAGSMEYVPEVQVPFVLHARRGDQELTAPRDWSFILPFVRISIYSIPRPTIPLSIRRGYVDSVRIDPGGIVLVTPPDFSGPYGSVEVEIPRPEIDTLFTATGFNGAGRAQDTAMWRNLAPTVEFGRDVPELVDDFYYDYGILGMRWDWWGDADLATEAAYLHPGQTTPVPMDPSPWFVGEFHARETFWLDDPGHLVMIAANDAHTVAESIPMGFDSIRLFTIEADDPEIENGESTVLRWEIPATTPNGGFDVSNARLEPEGLGVDLVGSLEVTPTATTDYTLIAWIRRGYRDVRVRATTTVLVRDGESSMVALPMQPRPGEPFSLQLSIPEDATAATLEPGFGAIEPQSQSLVATTEAAVEFALTVTRPTGSETALLRVVPDESTGDATDTPSMPVASAFQMLPNVPNPFNPHTAIRFAGTRPGSMGLEIFDMRGRRVHRVDLGHRDEGVHEWIWNGRDASGQPLASGTYLVRVTGPEGSVSRKVVLTK